MKKMLLSHTVRRLFTRGVLPVCLLLLATAVYAASAVVVTGKVTDAKGLPLPGVTVRVKSMNIGTTTDAGGGYSIRVPDNATDLQFSYVGYETKEVPVNGRTVINVTLAIDKNALSEVVVVGYGTTQKKDLTGAVVSLSGDDIVKKGTTSPMAALQGQVAGVSINATSGLPGSGYNINIRGVNSLTGGQPLFVVDGVMTDNIDFLNPSEILRIDVLKDASSTAIYGSRGSNGVIIITTKSGRTGQAHFSYSGYVGIRSFSHMPHFLNAEKGITYTLDRGIIKDLYRGDPLTAPDNMFGFPSSGPAHEYWKKVIANKDFTDWVALLTKPSVQTNHYISASGGTDKVTYYVGTGFQADNGNIKGQDYKKYNFKVDVDAHVSDQWSMGADLNLAYSIRHLASTNVMEQLFRMPKWAPAYDSMGAPIQTPMVGISGNVSPIDVLKYNKYDVSDYYLISSFYLRFHPVQGITLKSTISPNAHFNNVGEYWDPIETKSAGGAQETKTDMLSYIWDNQLNAVKQVGDHKFNYDFIYSLQMNRSDNLYGFGWGLPFNSSYYNVGSASSLNTSSHYERSTLMSFTNRLNYSYKDKYLLTVTARWDGSSKLAPGHQWAFFPSAAVAWRLSQEPFIQEIPAISNLKVRLSFGYTGNNNIAPYTTQFAVDQQTYYDWNGKVANGFKPSAIANQNLTWERTREWNLGVDFGLLKNRITGDINVYDRLSLNLLMSRKLAVPTGWASMEDNVGSVSNKGVELHLNTVDINTRNFRWETSITFATNRNRIVELYGKKEDDVANRWFIGQPVDVVYAMVFDGVWQKDELKGYSAEDQRKLEGTAKVKDLNGDGKIDIEHDMKVLGSPLPSWTGGLSTTFTYKNWDLSLDFYTHQGVFEYSPFFKEFTDFNSKQILDVPYYMRDNPYTKARYSNTYPQPAYQGEYWGEDAEDYGYPGFNKDASFVRLQDVTLGYNMPSALLKKVGVGITSFRLYFNALNPYVWTKYQGYDPEWAGASINSEDPNSPSFSIYQFGAKIEF
jgi:TonB-linked SusC/RagA family outer membrane protein